MSAKGLNELREGAGRIDEGKRLRLLAIDDNPDNLTSLSAVVSERLPGAEIVTSTDGSAGLELARTQIPDVILLDVVMPGMDGYAVCEKLKSDPTLSCVPVLFLTALRGDRESRIRALEVGAEGFLCKPFDEVELTAQIRAMAKIREANQMRLQEQERLAALVVERTRALELELSERKRAEEQIRAQAALLDLAQDAISVRDIEGRIQYWNQSCERVTGWAAETVMGKSVVDFLKIEKALFDRATQVILSEGHWEGDYDLISKSGSIVSVASSWTLVRDDAGQPKAVLVISTDVTEQKKLKAQFLRAQRLEGIGSLASGIAHDLNNILAPIMMTASLLRETVQEPDVLAMLDTVESSAKRGAEIIKQLLTFARGKPGAIVPLPVRHLLQEMSKLVRETFPRDICPSVDAPRDLWALMGDATQVHQSLMNLCVNARDAMPDGGTLALRAWNVMISQAQASSIPQANAGPYVCISVSDTGTGIAPQDLDRIFDPFFTTKEIGKGTGLGLPTVLGIVRGHKGFVRVESNLGEGTTFELYFPASPQPQATPATALKTEAPGGRGELVLVVDDEPAVRSSIRRNLERKGYRVLTACEGAEGLEIFSHHRSEIRAVLTDMMMPTMNGPAMVNALRAIAPDLTVVGMTGLAERAGVRGLDGLNLTALLTKPFSRDELLTVLHASIHGKASSSGNGEMAAAHS